MARLPGISSLRAYGVAAMFALSFLAGCTTVGSSQADRSAQRQVIERFYQTLIILDVKGVPTRTQITELRPEVSERLARLLLAVRETQDLDVARHKGTEPPLLQGSIFHSLFEGASRVEGLEPELRPELAPDLGALSDPHASAPKVAWQVTLAYGQGSDAFVWSDRVWLMQEAGRWVLDDIQFQGSWDFGPKGRLTDLLRATIDP
jgi:hypothetical protein